MRKRFSCVDYTTSCIKSQITTDLSLFVSALFGMPGCVKNTFGRDHLYKKNRKIACNRGATQTIFGCLKMTQPIF